MPRFMGLVRMAEDHPAPPQSMIDAMDVYVGQQAAKGVFLDGGGLAPSAETINFIVKKGEVTRVDGPYAESKELVGGWAIMQYDTLEEAIVGSEEFAEVHREHWPECEFVSTLRQISDDGPPPADA